MTNSIREQVEFDLCRLRFQNRLRTLVFSGRLAHKGKEGRLECVFRVGVIPKNAPANSQNHWPVPQHQRFEYEFVAAGNESTEKFAVGIPGFALAEQGPAQAPDYGFKA